MMGIPISGASYISEDNMSVIQNTSKPASTLKRKCNAIAYHAIIESVAIRETLTGHERYENNPVDIIIKIVKGINIGILCH